MRAAASVILFVLLPAAPAASNRKPDFTKVTKLEAVEDVSPELYWLDNQTGTIHKYFSVLATQRNLVPFNLFGSKHNETLKNGSVEDLNSGDAWISDISADRDNGLIALDSRHNRILQVPTGIQRSWSVLVRPNSLRKPVAVILKGDFIYVMDKENTCLQVFKAQNGSLVQSVSLVPPFPDKLIAGERELVGMNYSSKTILRFILGDKSSGIPEGHIVGLQTTELSALVDPRDVAAMGSAYYILDHGRNQLAVWSPVMGNLTFTPYSPFAANPVAIAGVGSHLFFADDVSGSFRVLQRVEAADFLFDGQDVSLGLVQLYAYLLKNELLPTQKYQVQLGDTLQTIVKSKGLLPAGFSDAFNPLFCKLNSQSCNNASPNLSPGSVISLPDLPLQSFVGKKYVDLDALQRTTKHTVSLAEVSTSASPMEEVREKLRQYNPGIADVALELQTTGKFNVPTTIVRTTAMIPFEVRKSSDSLRKELNGKAHIVEAAGSVAKKQALSDLNSLGLQSGTSSAAEQGPTLPPSYFAAIHRSSVAALPTDVAIVDFPVNEKHPEFASDGASRLSQYLSPGSNVSATSTILIPADETLPPGHQAGRLDHGTHTAALIGGAKVGVNPNVRIKYVKFSDFPAAVSEGSIKIFNLSLGEPEYDTKSLSQGGISDVLSSWRDLIQLPENLNTLFIVAAGNERSTVTKTMLAAAGASSNVIVVTAADNANPAHRWLADDNQHGANVSFEYVNIFAPGQNLESATFDGGYAVASGTSQATAIVSGLASLLHSLNSTWWPWQMKERIIATSDLEPWIQDRYSTGGLINVNQALKNANADYVTFYDDQTHELVECRGSISDTEASRVLSIKTHSVGTVNLPLSNLKRLHKSSLNMFSIIYEQQDPRRVDDLDHGWDVVRVPEEVPLNALHNFNNVSWSPEPGGACAGTSNFNLDQVGDFVGRMR